MREWRYHSKLPSLSATWRRTVSERHAWVGPRAAAAAAVAGRPIRHEPCLYIGQRPALPSVARCWRIPAAAGPAFEPRRKSNAAGRRGDGQTVVVTRGTGTKKPAAESWQAGTQPNGLWGARRRNWKSGINKKSWEELMVCFPLARHGKKRTRRLQQLFYFYLPIRC